jgi:O-methyltransferase/methyltransferase family protein
MTQVAPDSILQVASGFMASKHLFVANEVGLFGHLADGPCTLDDLAVRSGIPQRRIRILADAMVALGFVAREGDRYRNGPVADAFLAGQTAADLGPLLRFWNRISYPWWAEQETAIRTGKGSVPFGAASDEFWTLAAEGMEALSAETAEALAATHDFGRHRRVLDLGGGIGTYLMAVLRRYAGLQATLFELPPTAAVARRHLAATPLAAVIEIVEGDFFTDPVPEGHDAVILTNVIHMFSPERNLALLRRIRNRVPDGARLLLVDLWTDPTHSQPTFAALLAGEFQIASGEGAAYSEEDLRGWLQESGWQFLERRPLVGPTGVVMAQTRS